MDLVKRIREKVPVEKAPLKKVLVGTAIFLFLFTVIGFFAVPPILKAVLIKKLSERLHRQVTIEKIAFNPFVLSTDIKGFVVKDRGNSATLLSFNELYVNLQTASLWKRGLIVKEIRIDRPYINIIRNEDATYNFSDLLAEEGKPQAKSEGKPLRFSLNNIQITNGSVDFLDGPKHTAHKVRNVAVAIPFISNLPYYVNTFVQPSFEAVFNDTPVSFKGKTKLFADSRETLFEIDVRDLDIPYYLAYSPFTMKFKIPSALLDVKTGISYVQYKNRPPSVNVAGRVAFRKIRIADTGGSRIIDLPLLDISISSTDLVERKINFAKILLQAPEIDLVRDQKGRVNLLALVPEKTAEKGKKTKTEKGADAASPEITAEEIRLTGGKITFADRSRKDVFRTGLDAVEVKVEHFSNGKDRKTAAELSFTTEANESLNFKGEFSVVPVASSGSVELKGLKLKKYSPYFPENLLAEVGDGNLDLSTGYEVAVAGDDLAARLSGLSSTLSSLKIKKKDEREDFLDIPVVSVKDTDVDLSKKEVTVGGLFTDRGMLKIQRLQDGGINLLSLLAPEQGKVAEPAQATKGKDEKPWKITLKRIEADRYTVKTEDLMPSQPVALSADRIRFRGDNISTGKNAKGKVSLSFKVGTGASVAANGTVVIDPLAANLNVDVKEFDIVPLQPYFTDKVKIMVLSGSISSKGALSAAYGKEAGPRVSYRGEASLSRFASVDKANAEDFLKWDSLYLSGMSIGYSPPDVRIDEIALSDFYSRIIVNENGTLNVQGIVEEGGQEPEGAASTTPRQGETAAVAAVPPLQKSQPGATRTVAIEKVTFQGGTINFSDRHIKPNYSANLLEIGGRISGLSSEESKFADVDLKGKLDNYAPLEIKGKINPLRDDLYVDLKVDFKDMDLSPVTPYSGKYAGYTIQKGKLALNLQYLIVKRKLDSRNDVFLDQLTLGDKVESPQATKLPVRLAIALLKNRKGEIKLDIPVTGYIDDPKFSVGSIVIKIILNILAKAATSPFALLGALFGGGEELSYIDFGYGSAAVNDEAEKKIEKLTRALYDRPALKLDIEGHVDPEKDREGLRESVFNRKIKAQKLKEMVKKGLPAVPVDEVKIEKEEYPKFLKMAYKEEKFPKPRNIIGMAKSLPDPEMEKLMRTHIEVKDDDLRLLASQRALNVRDHVLKSKQVEPERVFLIEPRSLSPEKKENLKNSRVDFRLK
jgi:hypothetical protein